MQQLPCMHACNFLRSNILVYVWCRCQPSSRSVSLHTPHCVLQTATLSASPASSLPRSTQVQAGMLRHHAVGRCRSKSRSLGWGDRLCCRDERPYLCTAGKPTRVGLNRMSIGMLLHCCQACCRTCCLGCCCCCNTVVCCCALLTALGLDKTNTHFPWTRR